MPVWAQRASEFSDITDEHVALPTGQLATGLLIFFALLWALLAEKGPLHHWAEEHSGCAVLLLVALPPTASLLIFG